MPNMGVSIANRLKERAAALKVSPDHLRVRYANECIIRRLAHSRWAEKFALKGGMMLPVWNEGDMFRPTADVDFSGLVDGNIETLKEMLRDLADMRPEWEGGVLPFDDGLEIVRKSIKEGRVNDVEVGGGQLLYEAKIHTIRLKMQIDASFNVREIPNLAVAEYPTMFHDSKKNPLPKPTLQMYPPELSAAEKLRAMVQYGSFNSRIKDYYDLYVLLDRFDFDVNVQAEAIRYAFAAQNRVIPDEFAALSEEFATEPKKVSAWNSLNRNTSFRGNPPDLLTMVERIKEGFGPAIEMARSSQGDAAPSASSIPTP